MTPTTGDLVILVRPRHSSDPRYPNEWVGDRLAVLATHQRVLNAIRKAQRAGQTRLFLQSSPGRRIIGSAEVETIEGAGDAVRVVFTAWSTLDEPSAGRCYGSSFYWVK